jgi:hypothetical protein
VGAGGSVIFYGLEYFPGHLGFHLEANHPFYALAWLGGGELIAQLGERWLAPGQRWTHLRTLLWPSLAICAVPATLLIGGAKVFSVSDPFMATLHGDYVQEFLPLWRTIRSFDPRALLEILQVGSLPVLAALVTLCYRRRDGSVVVWFATFVTAALTVMAWWQSRWLLNVLGASIALILVLLACWTATLRPFVRWAVAVVILGQFFVPNGVLRYVGAAKDVAARRIAPGEAANALSRDIAAAVRESQPNGEIVLLSSPNASVAIGYYGRLQTLGTLYWENSNGLKAAAKILGADTEAEAATLIRAHGVTHIAIVSEENFIRQYYRLLHPSAAEKEIRNCFGLRLMLDKSVPQWLQPLPYTIPEDLTALRATVMLFKVDFAGQDVISKPTSEPITD